MSWLQNLILKVAAKQAVKKLQLKEGPMDGTKKWYQSKTVLGGIYATLRGLYTLVGEVLLPAIGKPPLPPVPPLVDSVAGSLVGSVIVYGRITADRAIS